MIGEIKHHEHEEDKRKVRHNQLNNEREVNTYISRYETQTKSLQSAEKFSFKFKSEKRKGETCNEIFVFKWNIKTDKSF